MRNTDPITKSQIGEGAISSDKHNIGEQVKSKLKSNTNLIKNWGVGESRCSRRVSTFFEKDRVVIEESNNLRKTESINCYLTYGYSITAHTPPLWIIRYHDCPQPFFYNTK